MWPNIITILIVSQSGFGIPKYCLLQLWRKVTVCVSHQTFKKFQKLAQPLRPFRYRPGYFFLEPPTSFFFCAWTIWNNVLELNLILFWQTGLPPFSLDFSDRLPSEWPQNRYLSMISSTFCKTLPPLPSKCQCSYKFIVCTSLPDKCLL